MLSDDELWKKLAPVDDLMSEYTHALSEIPIEPRWKLSRHPTRKRNLEVSLLYRDLSSELPKRFSAFVEECVLFWSAGYREEQAEEPNFGELCSSLSQTEQEVFQGAQFMTANRKSYEVEQDGVGCYVGYGWAEAGKDMELLRTALSNGTNRLATKYWVTS